VCSKDGFEVVLTWSRDWSKRQRNRCVYNKAAVRV